MMEVSEKIFFRALAGGNYLSTTFLKTILIVSIVVLFLYRASYTLISDHATGDQRAYLGIAMKLEKFGFREYNLRHIDRLYPQGMVEYIYSEEPKGELLRSYINEGTLQYDQPLFHAPPLFSYLLSFSHRWFSPDHGYKVLFPQAAQTMGLRERLKVQFYSSFVPLFSGLVLIVATFCIGRLIFDYWTGIISMVLIAVSPATVLASERIWADTLLAALVTLTFLFLLYYLRSQRLIFLILSATGYGLALLTKNTALFLVPALLLAAIYFSNRNGGGRKSSLFIMAIFSILVLILTLPWYYCVYKTFGTPLFDPKQEGISKVYFWWAFQKSRPWYTYLVSIPTMVPLFLLGYYRVVGVLRQRKLSSEVLLVVWFLSFFISIILITQFSEMLGPDSRYMLPAYPPLAILAASQIMRFKVWLASRFSASVARFAIIASLIICCAWSYSLSDPAYAQFPQMYKNFMNMPW